MPSTTSNSNTSNPQEVSLTVNRLPPPPYSETNQHTHNPQSIRLQPQRSSNGDVPYDAPPRAVFVAEEHPPASGDRLGQHTPSMSGLTVSSSREPVHALCIHCRSTMITDTGTSNGQAVFGCMFLCLLLG